MHAMKNFQNPLDENFSYGYDNGVYNFRESADSQFQCNYKRAQYVPTSFKDECIKVCEKISDYAMSIGRVPIVLLSGGLDSEIVVRSFIESGRPFKIVSNKFSNNLNEHEITLIERFSKKYNLEVAYIELDIENALSSPRYLEMAEIAKCSYSEMLPTMDLIDRVYFEMNGIPVLGNGDFYASKINDIWTYTEFEYILAWMRYAVGKEIIGSINFFQQTPEIVLAMALDPIIKQTISDDKESTIRHSKYLVYQKYWSDAEIRPKYNGAEFVQTLCDQVNDQFLYRYKDYTNKWTMTVYRFLKNMMPDDYYR